MYLTCPRCRTVYAARAELLRLGQGEVRCGACRTVFNALDVLSDDLPEQPGIIPPPGSVQAPPTSEATPIAQPQPPHDDVEPLVPAVLREDWARLERTREPMRGTLGWTATALVLLVAIAAQYLWFSPGDAMERFPQSRGLVAAFCATAGCAPPQRRDPSQFRMLSRDVRAHPEYEGALLVTATFSNAAPWPQPLPRLGFTLYNVNGQTVAARVFEPQVYLREEVAAARTLAPGQSAQVALEMLAPEEAAVSFEFFFL